MNAATVGESPSTIQSRVPCIFDEARHDWRWRPGDISADFTNHSRDANLESAASLHDLMTFGVFGTEGQVLALEKHWVDSEEGELRFVVEGKPARAGIDPHYFLIDKHTHDNVIPVTLE